MPSVSVVIASYNRAERLRRALDSVADQTFTDWECLVCDDGSTDGSVELVRERATRDSRFRLIEGPRAGRPAVPRNRGVQAAAGTWVAFLDDDDHWHPQKLARQMAIAAAHSCEGVSMRSLHYSDPDIPEFTAVSEPPRPTPLTFIDVLTQRGAWPDTSATMVTRDAVLRAGGFPESAAYRAVEDFDLWIRLLARPGFTWLIDTGAPMVAYRDQGEDSISGWSRVVDPDIIRQRWAVIDTTVRILAALPECGDDRAAAFDVLVRRADDCAGRCQAVGWRRSVVIALLVGSAASARIGRWHDAALRLYRAARAVLKTMPRGVDAPPLVTLLERRALRYIPAMLVGRSQGIAALPLDSSGRSTTLEQSV